MNKSSYRKLTNELEKFSYKEIADKAAQALSKDRNLTKDYSTYFVEFRTQINKVVKYKHQWKLKELIKIAIKYGYPPSNRDSKFYDLYRTIIRCYETLSNGLDSEDYDNPFPSLKVLKENYIKSGVACGCQIGYCNYCY